MKKHLLTMSIALMSIGITNTVMAQATESATATATIITPIGIEHVSDMNFGDIALNAGETGTVVISSTTGVRTESAEVTLPNTFGTTQAEAEFAVSGENSYTYSISLPTTLVLSGSNGGVMTVSEFETDATATFSALGAETVKIGAKLTLIASQTAGVYTNAAGFDVTVNYN